MTKDEQISNELIEILDADNRMTHKLTALRRMLHTAYVEGYEDALSGMSRHLTDRNKTRV